MLIIMVIPMKKEEKRNLYKWSEIQKSTIEEFLILITVSDNTCCNYGHEIATVVIQKQYTTYKWTTKM